MNTAAFPAAVEALARVRGVVAALLVSPGDGIVIESILHVGHDGARLAALVACLYRKARRCAASAGLGHCGFLHLEAEHGHIGAIGGDDLLLVLVADASVNVGAMRIAMLRAATDLTA